VKFQSAKRPKICIIATTPISIHSFLKDHVNKLSEFSDITILTNFENDLYSPKLNLNVDFKQIGIKRSISPLSDFLVLFNLTKLFLFEQYDLIWSVGPKSGLLGMVAGKFAGIKSRLFIFQGEVWASKKGVFRFFLKFIDSIVAFCATDLLAVSHSERDFLIKEGIVRSAKIKVLGNGAICGVDVIYKKDFHQSIVNRNELDIPKSAIVLLFLGRINSDKGVFELASAFSKVAETNTSIWLLFVGPDEAMIMPSIYKILGYHSSRFRYVGFTENTKKYYELADVFCLPSYREGFPISILEAAACGLPTIGSRIYGISDAIIHKNTGLLFDPYDILDLIKSIKSISASGELRDRLGCAAQKRVADLYSRNLISDRYVEHILSLVYR
jgi:glycosyltransferase involved in cell wall biosynthesis